MKNLDKILLFFTLLISLYLYKIFPEEEIKWDWTKIDTSLESQIKNFKTIPKDFIWGTATAAHQGILLKIFKKKVKKIKIKKVEGDSNNNQWTFYEATGKIPKAGKAVDQWNRYKEDVALIKQLGLNSYRCSVEWSKIEPKQGEFSKDALQHYKDLIEECLKNNIKPMITFLHFTHPSINILKNSLV
jgi:beta-glucosidase